VKRVSSLLPEAKQSIPRWEADFTVQQVTSHFISCCILLSHDTSLPLLFQEFVIGSNTWEEENSNNHEEKAGERIGMVKSKSNVFPYRLNNQPVIHGAMRPGSVTTATKIPRTTPRCVCSIVEVMVTNVGMATAKRARVNKSAHPTAEGTLSARYTQR